MDDVPHDASSLRRVVLGWQIVGLALNDVIGSGVYLLPAAAAALLGPASLWAVPIAGLAVSLLVLCFAEAASYVSEPGGAYVYAREAFGDFVGFEVGWMTWLARVASVASLSVGFAQALTYVSPAFQDPIPRVLAIVVPMLALTAINVVGVRSGVGTALFLLASKLIPLLLFVTVGLVHASGAVVSSQPPGSGRWGEAALLLLFAYAGFENTPAAAGEYRRPRRDVPAALIVHVAVVTLLYFAVQWVALGTLPGLATSETPLADAAASFIGGWAGVVLTVGAALSILGTNGNTVLAGPRYLFALARDGFGPRGLGQVHPRYRTPAAAVLFQAAVVLPLALSGTFVGLAKLSIMARLATYVGTALAVPILRRRVGQSVDGLRLPGGPAIPFAAALLAASLAASVDSTHLLAGAAALVLGALVFRLRRRA